MLGEQIERGETIAVIHAEDEAAWSQAAQALKSSYTISDQPPEKTPLIYGRVEGVDKNEA